MSRIRTAIAVTAAALVLLSSAGVAAALVEMTGVDAPSSAEPGETITVSASGRSTGDKPTDVTIYLFRMDTKETVCKASGTSPTELWCSQQIEMPDHDLELRAYIQSGTRIVEDEWATITVEAPDTTEEDDGNGAGPTTTTSEPGESTTVREEQPLPGDYTVNESSGLIETEQGSGGGDDGDDGLLGRVIGGLTDTAKDGLVTVLTDFVATSALGLLTTLVKSLAFILSYVPDVHGNPAVSDIHRLTMTIAFAFTSAAVAFTGLLYQVGPVFGISYGQVRILLPRIIVALAFGLIALPLLQLAVDLANALTLAFTPDMLHSTISEAIGTGTVAIIALLIQATVLLGVIVAYLIADVYIMFVAAISPLIALAWAMPRTRRYAASFIGGWWTALAMGPLAMLTLRFTFRLMRGGGSSVGQSIGNWIYGLVGFVLLLIVPYQLYGASQAVTMQGMRLANGAKRRARKEYYRRSGRRTEDWEDAEHAPRQWDSHSTDAMNDGRRRNW